MTHILTIQNYLQSPIAILVGLIQKAFNLVEGLYESIQKAREIQRGVAELSCLTDAELKDIGIGRGDIYAVASGHKDMTRSIDVQENENLKGFV